MKGGTTRKKVGKDASGNCVIEISPTGQNRNGRGGGEGKAQKGRGENEVQDVGGGSVDFCNHPESKRGGGGGGKAKCEGN